MRTMHRLRGIVFGAAVTAALAFGASSATAAPGTAPSPRLEKYCGYFSSSSICAACCRGYPNYYWDTGPCYCF